MKCLCERVKDHNVGEKEESEWMSRQSDKKKKNKIRFESQITYGCKDIILFIFFPVTLD